MHRLTGYRRARQLMVCALSTAVASIVAAPPAVAGWPVSPASRASIWTIAGSGLQAPSGDGGPAISEQLANPCGVAVDAAGDVLIADRDGGRVLMVRPNGLISTVADGLSAPTGVAVDAAGNVLIAEAWANEIRRVTPDGVISTIAGTGPYGSSGDGGPATDAELSGPVGVTVDAAGDVLIADQGDNRIRRVTPDGVISTLAGTGTGGFSGDGGPAVDAQLSGPVGVAFDAAGDLLIADQGNNRIRRVTPGGIISTFAGSRIAGFAGDGGEATDAGLNRPVGIVADAAGDILIADTFDGRVRKVSPAGLISTVAGGGVALGNDGPGTAARLFEPASVAVDQAGNVLIADTGEYRVRRLTPDGVISAFAGTGELGTAQVFSGDGGEAIDATLHAPSAVAVDSAGDALVVDGGNQRVRRVTPDGVISTFAGTGAEGSGGDGGPAVQARLFEPTAIAVDGEGDVLIADTGNNRVRRVTPAGVISTFAGTGAVGSTGDGGLATAATLKAPSGLAVDAAGDVLISDTGNNRVRKVSPLGVISRLAGTSVPGSAGDGGPARDAELRRPIGLAVDAAGDVLIADSGNRRLRRVSPDGIISTFATGVAAAGIAVDAAGDVITAEDLFVRRVRPSGAATTLAGIGAAGSSGGFSGDGGPAEEAQLNGATSVAVDADGSILVVDSGNGRVRILIEPPVQPVVTDGDAGPAGTAGPPGAAGPAAGSTGPAARSSVVHLAAVTFRARVGAGSVRVRYFLTARARIALRVSPRGGRPRIVATGTGRSGRNTITWNRRLAGHAAKPGVYTLTVRATAGGTTTTSSIVVRLLPAGGRSTHRR